MQIKNVCNVGLSAVGMQGDFVSDATDLLIHHWDQLLPNSGLSEVDRKLCSYNNDLGPQVIPKNLKQSQPEHKSPRKTAFSSVLLA